MTHSKSTTESSATFTPGPWTVVERYDGSRTVAIMRDFRPDASVGVHVEAASDWVHPATAEQIFANARLIAAAPDMLQALREIVGDCYALDGSSPEPHCRFCDHSEGAKHDADCVMQFVDAAIAKAVRP